MPWGQNITLDEQLRHEHDNPAIGVLLCKNKNRVIAEYALRDVNEPIGVAEYQLVQALPAQLEANLPSIARLEAELTEADIDELEQRPAPTKTKTTKRRATKTTNARSKKAKR